MGLATRELYNQYEEHMYNGSTITTVNGFHRGIPGHLDPSRFATLPGHIQLAICAIPLAHPMFFAGMLLVWTMTVIADVRRLVYLASLFVLHVPQVDTLGDIF